MKLRVLFLRKIHILYSILFILFCLGSVLYISSIRTDSDVFATVRENTILKSDLTGDGKEDTLYINTEKDKYYLQVNYQSKSYPIVPNRRLNTLGYYYPYNPMKISFMDITRDKVPEIFIQSMEKGTPIQHIFSWDGSSFKDLFCSNNNVMGVIDSKNNRTPKFVSGTLASNTVNISYYMQIGSKLDKIEYTDNLYGKSEIATFIDYIQSLPSGEANKPSDIFYPGITGPDLSLIGKLAAEGKLYKFNDAFFSDTKYDKDGHVTEYKWIINFKEVPTLKDGASENMSINVKLKRSTLDGNPYKIYSISQNNK